MPILYLRSRVVKAHEPVSVQALGAELAIETIDVAVIGRLAWPRKVEHDTVVISPEIKISGDEFAAIIDANGRGISDLPADPFQCLNHVLALVCQSARKVGSDSYVERPGWQGFSAQITSGRCSHMSGLSARSSGALAKPMPTIRCTHCKRQIRNAKPVLPK